MVMMMPNIDAVNILANKHEVRHLFVHTLRCQCHVLFLVCLIFWEKNQWEESTWVSVSLSFLRSTLTLFLYSHSTCTPSLIEAVLL